VGLHARAGSYFRPPGQMAPDPPVTGDYCGLRREGSIPVPLPPPASLQPPVLCAKMLGIEPSISSDFCFGFRTSKRQSPPFYSEWLNSLQSSGLRVFGTVLEIRVFRAADEF